MGVFEVKAPLAELHFVAAATEEDGLGKHRHRGPLRPDAPKRPCGCYNDLEPRRLEEGRRKEGGRWREEEGGGREEEDNEEER